MTFSTSKHRSMLSTAKKLIPVEIKNIYHGHKYSDYRYKSNAKNLCSVHKNKSCIIIGPGQRSTSSDDDYDYVICLNQSQTTINPSKKLNVLLDSTYFNHNSLNYQFTSGLAADGQKNLITVTRNLPHTSRQVLNSVLLAYSADLVIPFLRFPSVFSPPVFNFSRIANYYDASMSTYSPANVLCLALSAAIHLGFSQIHIDGCTGEWLREPISADRWSSQSPMYSTDYLLAKQEHYSEMRRLVAEQRAAAKCKLLRDPDCQQYTSYYTLIDYCRYIHFYLHHLAHAASLNGSMICNLSANSYFDMF